ncbi:MAG: PEGA domain-containing protein [Polyangiaceae bacterium]|nr:PEGA domain-containing protein [Polyangiaceae bacterium]MCW5789066.1 PEGA domain-containing protein [Polyangiaceae bacterium]
MRTAVRRWWWSLGLLTLALVCLVPASNASAQGSVDATGQKLDSIRRYMEKGQGLYVAGDYTAAAAQFEAGYAQHPYSAFLFNAGVCYQKQGDNSKALERFREYLRVDPSAPDAEKVRARIASLEAAAAPVGDAGVGEDAGPGDAGAATPPLPSDDQDAMRSLVVVETDPPGAPVVLYERGAGAAPFKVGGENPGWTQVFSGTSPSETSLAVGRYQIVVEKFRDFNVSQTNIDVLAGHVHHFKANLSQGAFMAFLRVSANVRGAYVYLDDRAKKRPEWGTTPYGALVPSGEREVLVEAPGFQPLLTKVQVKHGEQKELEVTLRRVDYGTIRVDANAPDAKIAIDEKPVGVWRSGEEPLEVKLSSGRHKLTIESSGRKTYEGEIDVPKGQTLPIRANLIPKYPRGAAWTQAVIGAVVLGASIYVGTESDRLHDELVADREAGVLEEGDERITRGQIFAIGADAGFVVSGVLGVLAVYNFLKDPLPDSSIKQGKPVEFRDPKQARPSARRLLPSRVAREERAPKRPSAEAGGLYVTPQISGQSGWLLFGGSF